MLGFERRFERKRAVREAELIVTGYYDNLETAEEIAKIVAEDENTYLSGIDRLAEIHPLDRRVTFLVPSFVAANIKSTIERGYKIMRKNKEYPIEEGLGACLASIFEVVPNEDGNSNINISRREIDEINHRLKNDGLHYEPATIIFNENFASANNGIYARNYVFRSNKVSDKSTGW